MIVMIYVALYMRCSTDMQDMSIKDQREILIRYCKKKGYKIVKEFIDEGLSGTTFDKRPGAMRLFQVVDSGSANFSKVIILNESRFGRVPNPKEAIHHEYLMEKKGVVIEYVQSESNLPGAAGLIMRAVKYDQAAQFSKQLSDDVIRGHRTAAKKGYSTGGFPPFGYKRMMLDASGNPMHILEAGQRKAIKNNWVKWVPGDRREIAIVRRIFRLYVLGGKGIKAIAVTLNKEKIPSPKGKSWGPFTIISILKNRAYIGERIYGGKWAKVVTDADKVVCSKAHQPIISEALFEQAQILMKSRELGKSNGMRTEYLLSGKIVCNDCGYKFQGRRARNNSGKIYTYYVDSGFQNYKVCGSLHLPKESNGEVIGIEDFVIQQIQILLDKEEYIDRFKKHIRDQLIAAEKEVDSEYPALVKRLKEIDREIVSIQNILIDTPSKSLKKRLLETEDEKEALLKELKSYDMINKSPSNVLKLVNEYSKALKNLAEMLKTRHPSEQKTAIALFLDKIEVSRKEGVARCYFYDLPRPKGVDYIFSAKEKSCVCQIGAEGGI